MNIAILFGGSSFEHEISIVSAITLKKVFKKSNLSFIFVDSSREFYLIESTDMKSNYFSGGSYKKAKVRQIARRLGLPNAEDVRQGIIAFKIAAHATDIARGRKDARNIDDEMSDARYNFDWNKQFELALDPEKAKEFHDETLPQDVFKEAEFCSMCGPKFCAYKITQNIMDDQESIQEIIKENEESEK